MNKKEKMLKSLFAVAVDGGCSNAYELIIRVMEQMPVEAKKVPFTLLELHNALLPLSKKWEKEIKKVIF